MGTTWLIAKPASREYFYLGKGGPMFDVVFPEQTTLFTFPGQFGTLAEFTLLLEDEFAGYYTEDHPIELAKSARGLATSLWSWAGIDQVTCMTEHDHDAWFDTHGSYMTQTGDRYPDDDC